VRLPANTSRPAALIMILAVLQVLCATAFLSINGFHGINSILFLLCGTGIAFLLPGVSCQVPAKKQWLNRQLPVKLIVIAALLPFSYLLAMKIMDGTPLEIEHADMLPIMKVMCARFLDGELAQVYETIPEIWKGIQPIYLPAMWMPFTPSLLLDFDMRWITVCGIWLSVIACVWPGIWKRSWTTLLFALSMLLLLAWFHFEKTNNVIRLTEEGVVFFYYTLLVLAIFSGNPWLIGLSAALCLLSRYALIGWIPFAGLYLLYIKQYRFLAKTAAAGIAVILLLVILPFGIKPLSLHINLPMQYAAHAERVWAETPVVFEKSLGMAKFFGSENSRVLNAILIIGSFLVPIAFFFYIRKKKLALPIVLLSGLQLSVTFFYNFLDVSYLYLYYTPVFISLAIAGYSNMVCKKDFIQPHNSEA
jgi:hypothetical protein